MSCDHELANEWARCGGKNRQLYNNDNCLVANMMLNRARQKVSKFCIICKITKCVMEVRLLRKVIDTFFSQLYSNHKALVGALPKFYPHIDIRAENRSRLSIYRVSEYGIEWVRKVFCELVEISFISGGIRPLHKFFWAGFEFNRSLTYFQDCLKYLITDFRE